MSDAAHGAVIERLHSSGKALLSALSGEIAARLASAVRDRGVASCVVTGGTTPGPLYDLLSTADLPWERIIITLSDERWVDPASEASNEHLVRTRLLQNRAAAARLWGLRTDDADPNKAESVVDGMIARLPRPFDMVLLGMGADGHVASLFPNAPETAVAADVDRPALACAVKREGAAGADQRLSLTFRALRDARWTAILITGDEKLAVARRARIGDDVVELPVRGILNAPAAPVQIWWTA
jgi:6-phosphogluconolactonase